MGHTDLMSMSHSCFLATIDGSSCLAEPVSLSSWSKNLNVVARRHLVRSPKDLGNRCSCFSNL